MSKISDYINHLKESDSKTKHKAALTFSITLSALCLIIFYFIFGSRIFNFSNNAEQVDNQNSVSKNLEDSSNTKNDVVSPFTSFATFLKDSGEQFSKIKKDLSSSVSSSSSN